MTTSINRQLTLLVQGILEKHKIDSLQLEVDLVSSLQRMWTEGGRDPSKLAEIRENILKSMLAGAARVEKLASMESRVKMSLGIETNGGSRYEDMLNFLLKKDSEGQSVEEYAKWCKDNPFEAPKPFQISMRPALLSETWPMAFQKPQVVERPEHVVFTGGEDVPNAVPNPFQKPAILRRPTQVDSD